MDLNVQKTIKEQLHNSFETHFAETVAQQLSTGQSVKLDLAMSVLKPLCARWLVSAIDYPKSHQDIVFFIVLGSLEFKAFLDIKHEKIVLNRSKQVHFKT